MCTIANIKVKLADEELMSTLRDEINRCLDDDYDVDDEDESRGPAIRLNDINIDYVKETINNLNYVSHDFVVNNRLENSYQCATESVGISLASTIPYAEERVLDIIVNIEDTEVLNVDHDYHHTLAVIDSVGDWRDDESDLDVDNFAKELISFCEVINSHYTNIIDRELCLGLIHLGEVKT